MDRRNSGRKHKAHSASRGVHALREEISARDASPRRTVATRHPAGCLTAAIMVDAANRPNRSRDTDWGSSSLWKRKPLTTVRTASLGRPMMCWLGPAYRKPGTTLAVNQTRCQYTSEGNMIWRGEVTSIPVLSAPLFWRTTYSTIMKPDVLLQIRARREQGPFANTPAARAPAGVAIPGSPADPPKP